MEQTHFRQKTLVLLMFFVLVASVLAVEDEDKRKENQKKKKNRVAYALIPAYIAAAILSFIFIAWGLFRICHNWGWWRIHAPSPRPQYSRTLFGWVDRETLESKQAKRASLKKTKRDQRKIYRTAKADYRWVFHDPTGELRQRYDNQKERSYLRLLPSSMRSYPHGALQFNKITTPGKASKGIYQPPEVQLSFRGCLTTPNSLELAQFDGSSFSDALQNPCNESNLSIMTFIDAITPVAVDKLWLRSRMPAAHQPDTIQVWHVRERPLPGLMGMPEFESEQEMDGGIEQQQTVVETMDREVEQQQTVVETMDREVEQQQTFVETMDREVEQQQTFVENMDREVEQQGTWIGRDMEQRPVEGSLPQRIIILNINTLPRDDFGRSPGHPLELSIPPVRDTSGPVARQRFFVELEARLQELLSDPSLVLVYYSLDILLQLYDQAVLASPRQAPIVSRPPSSVPANVPENVNYAGRLRHYVRLLNEQFEDLQGQIQDPNLIHVGLRSELGRSIENVRHQLRSVRAALERLGPIASVRSVDELYPTPNTAMILEPTSTPIQIRLMGFERMPIHNRNTFNRNTAMGSEPRQIATPGMRLSNVAVRAQVILDGVDEFHRIVTLYTESRYRAFLGGSVAQDLEAFVRDMSALTRVLRGLNMVRDDLATARLDSAQPTNQRMLLYVQTVNSFTPTIATPQIHRQAHHAVIESLAAGDDDSAISFSGVEVHGENNRYINEGSTTDIISSLYPTAEENVQRIIQHPNTAERESSPPDYDSLVDHADSAAHPSPEPEDLVHAEATRQTAASHSETRSSEDPPAPHNQEAHDEEEASLTALLEDLSLFTATLSARPAPTTPVNALATPDSEELEGAINDELYTDAY